MKKMLLLLSLIIVPAWAAEVAPAPSATTPAAEATQAAKPATKHKTRKPKKKNKVAAKVTEEKLMSTTTATCAKQTCGGNTGCFQLRCGPACSSGC